MCLFDVWCVWCVWCRASDVCVVFGAAGDGVFVCLFVWSFLFCVLYLVFDVFGVCV